MDSMKEVMELGVEKRLRNSSADKIDGNGWYNEKANKYDKLNLC